MAGSRTLKLSILADVDDLKKKLGQGQDEVSSFGDKLGEFGKKAAAAFAVAAAAAAAYAGKLLIEGVKSAIEDEKAQTRLATTLENVTGATKNQIAAVEQQIAKLSLANGITDDQLRPSFERLVRATDDITKAQKLQALALDVSAGSGKSLESVSAALARAFDGNTSALSRLGIGLSTTELKSMSFDDVTKQLANTFGGQAAIQADTFEGRMRRLQVAFDEAKESIGARLLPILTNLVTYFTNNLGPVIESIKNKLEPLRKAIDDNKEEFKALWDFLSQYLVPFISGAMKLALSGLISGITSIVNIVGKAITFFQSLYDKYKQFVDLLKNNPISKFLGKINPFDNASFSNAGFLVAGQTQTTSQTISDNVGENPLEQLFANPNFGKNIVSNLNIAEKRLIDQYFATGQTGRLENPMFGQTMNDLNDIVQGIQAQRNAYNLARSQMAATNVVVNVNSPSVIDQEGFSRAVVQALNTAADRGTGGGSAIVTV